MLNFHNKVVSDALPFLLFLSRAINMLLFGVYDLTYLSLSDNKSGAIIQGSGRRKKWKDPPIWFLYHCRN